MKHILALIIITTVFYTQFCQAQIDTELAKKYFEEINTLTQIDNGELWGISLSGPFMFVDQKSREIIANKADNNGELKKQDNLFQGKLPENINIANTSLEWNGTKWTMVIWQAVQHDSEFARKSLFMHESWHRIQNDIGIKAVMSANTHFDELNGTIWLKMELKALKAALQTTDKKEQKQALTDAILFRLYRQDLFPDNNENDFERHEGMAEYTGIKLCGITEEKLKLIAIEKINAALKSDGFSNSYAYTTGPSYAFIFEDLGFAFIEKVKLGQALPDIAINYLQTTFPETKDQLKKLTEEIGIKYNIEETTKEETDKFKLIQEEIDAYTLKIIKKPKLVIKNNGLQFRFNPQEKLLKLNENNILYKTMRITAEWGILEVTDGIVRTTDWQAFMVQSPSTTNGSEFIENGYTLKLNEGYYLKEIKGGRFMVITK